MAVRLISWPVVEGKWPMAGNLFKMYTYMLCCFEILYNDSDINFLMFHLIL